ncbi:hypothetical protein PJF56_03865 [Roseofilum sp. BLCC_M91]|uniref:DUF104 domain-containing protein n=1 Tax=Roseofilum halophilum BLCC-M91 TaxID=3022259 RepID=A0ABT7BFZ7_9CYAN|nr:hypothetical protein [Roseofilum halophilum]MDJ1177995.1 hypothetical protein [Roseofilum halophilum BLCC-M91]
MDVKLKSISETKQTMYKILNATYQNGNLILERKLESIREGQTFKVVLLETDELNLRKQHFLQLVDKHSFPLSQDAPFNREQLHER